MCVSPWGHFMRARLTGNTTNAVNDTVYHLFANGVVATSIYFCQRLYVL
jgi:hypothetical protein